jgi:hypothetical protein
VSVDGDGTHDAINNSVMLISQDSDAETPADPPPMLDMTPPAQRSAIEAGVIVDARRRQRRRRLLGALLGGAAVGLGLVFGLAGGGGHGRGVSHPPQSGSPLRLTFVDGLPLVDGQLLPLAVSPSFQAGDVGLCVMYLGGGSCNGPYPGPRLPLFDQGTTIGTVSWPGEVDSEIVGPEVAAVHVQGLGTFTPVRFPGLPRGERVAAFYRPAGSRGTLVLAGSDQGVSPGPGSPEHPVVLVSALDRAGHPIRMDPRRDTVRLLPNSYWQAPAGPPANGRCALANNTPGARVQWGQVATTIASDASSGADEFLTCMQSWFSVPGGAFQAVVLLDARSPGSVPGPLWGAVPVPGHSGVVEIRARTAYPPRRAALRLGTAGQARIAKQVGAQAERRLAAGYLPPIVIQPLTLARRVGAAWILVLNGGTLGNELRLLDGLKLSKLALGQRPGHTTGSTKLG